MLLFLFLFSFSLPCSANPLAFLSLFFFASFFLFFFFFSKKKQVAWCFCFVCIFSCRVFGVGVFTRSIFLSSFIAHGLSARFLHLLNAILLFTFGIGEALLV